MTESELIKRITDMRDENRQHEKEIADIKDYNRRLENENKHLTERVKMLEYEKNKLLDDLKRVGGNKERDIAAGQLMAYREMFEKILGSDLN